MNQVEIQWHDLDDESTANLEDFTGFYALVAENIEDEESDEVDLLDISMAYQENILDKMDDPESHYEFLTNYLDDHPEMDIFFMMGIVKKSSLSPVTENFLKDVHCLLLASNEPVFSDLCEDPGENVPEALMIENTGDFPPLEEVSELV